MRFLLDEDVYVCLRFVLEAWGHDARHVKLERGLPGGDDPDLLREAARQKRVLVTFNVEDFERLHEEWRLAGRGHAGIVVSRKVEGYENFATLLRWMQNMLKTLPPSSFPDAIHYAHTFA